MLNIEASTSNSLVSINNGGQVNIYGAYRLNNRQQAIGFELNTGTINDFSGSSQSGYRSNHSGVSAQIAFSSSTGVIFVNMQYRGTDGTKGLLVESAIGQPIL